MRLASVSFVILAAACAACTADPPADPGDDDPGPDAGPIESTVFEIDCAGVEVAATVVTDGASYDPGEVTIGAGEVVHFDLGLGHDARSDDGLFLVDFAGDVCLRFDEPGSYGFHCTPHGFRGTVNVE